MTFPQKLESIYLTMNNKIVTGLVSKIKFFLFTIKRQLLCHWLVCWLFFGTILSSLVAF